MCKNHNLEFTSKDELKIIDRNITLLEPVFRECRICSSINIISIIPQTKNNDEEKHKFNQCIDCGYKLKIKF